MVHWERIFDHGRKRVVFILRQTPTQTLDSPFSRNEIGPYSRRLRHPKKCLFASCEVEYLGNSIGRYGVCVRADRTEALRNWTRPENVSKLRSFLGLIGFLRRYIRDFAQIAVSLNSLLKKGAAWQWGDAEEYAFEKLKSRCTDVPVLAIPRRDGKLVLRTDTSRYAMGCDLYQEDTDGFLQPI